MSPGASVAAIGLLCMPAAVALAAYPCCTSDVPDYVNHQ